jgi:hypothetical protein
MPNDPATPASPNARTDDSRRVVAAVAGGLAVVGGGIGAGFGVAARNDKSQFDKHPTINAGNAGNDNAVYSDAAFGAAVVLGATSVVLFFTGRDQPDSPPPTPVAAQKPAGASPAKGASSRSVTFAAAPVLLPQGGGASALLRF